ncbi:MAG: right-handed parallel beta-helix repeat-containing protein [Planctomycetota bacterium]
MFIWYGPTLTNCAFSGNWARWGGGMCNWGYCSGVLTNCTFSGNTAENGGAMVITKSSTATLTNCTFTGNGASGGPAGAIDCSGDCSGTLVNTILWGNSPNEIDLWESSITVTHSDVQGGWRGIGNISGDPLFADPTNGDYHLKSQAGRWDPNSGSWVKDDVTSPCIDAGDPNSDWSGETWPHGGRVNMGAYGGTREASMSIQPQPMSLPRIAYIYGSDAGAAQSFQSLLVDYGCPTILVGLDQAPAVGLEGLDLIIVGDDTENAAAWNDPQVAAAIQGSGRPIVGMGEGGYDFFGVLGLSIGWPNGAHGDGDSISVIDPKHPLFVVPYAIEIPQDRVLRLYTQSKNATLYLPLVPETVTLLAGDAAYPGYYPLALEHDRYLFWGFTESPEKMTEVGKTLFINVVIRTANAAW